MCKAKSKSLSNYVPHLFRFFFKFRSLNMICKIFGGNFTAQKPQKKQKEDIVGAKLWYISL